VRLLLAVPVFAILCAVFLAAAPAIVQQRVLSIFNPQDATNRDRIAMIESGVRMVQDRPWTGVGLNMVELAYPRYRTADAVDPAGATGPTSRVHLHNVPVQLAAERGLPALAAWLWFVAVAGRDLLRQLRQGPHKALAGAGMAALVAMLAAGLFEHNFGDSEFLVLFLGLITLPYAASRTDPSALPAGTGSRARDRELAGAAVR
jgi:putative inorganic carbon (HCO3(-)) transporter